MKQYLDRLMDDDSEAYEELLKDIQWKVRRTLSYSIHEIALILGPKLTQDSLLPALDTLSLTNFHNMTMGEGFVPASAAAKASLQEAWDRQHVHRRLMFPQGLSFG